MTIDVTDYQVGSSFPPWPFSLAERDVRIQTWSRRSARIPVRSFDSSWMVRNRVSSDVNPSWKSSVYKTSLLTLFLLQTITVVRNVNLRLKPDDLVLVSFVYKLVCRLLYTKQNEHIYVWRPDSTDENRLSVVPPGNVCTWYGLCPFRSDPLTWPETNLGSHSTQRGTR